MAYFLVLQFPAAQMGFCSGLYDIQMLPNAAKSHNADLISENGGR